MCMHVFERGAPTGLGFTAFEADQVSLVIFIHIQSIQIERHMNVTWQGVGELWHVTIWNWEYNGRDGPRSKSRIPSAASGGGLNPKENGTVSLHFNLLGSLKIEAEGGPSELLKSPNGCALVAYLIVTRQTQTREFLADFFWEANTTRQTLHNLRALLNRIRDLVPELQITRTSLAFQPLAETTVDFLSLQAVLDQNLAQIDLSQLDSALQWYRGDLLANFYLEGAPRFEEWLVLERERLRQKVHAAHQRLCNTYLEREQWTDGLALAQRWLGLDPLNEEAIRVCMQSLAARGEPGAGLQHYETFRQQLWGQLELDPEPATAALAARLAELLEEQGQGMTWEHITVPAFPGPGELPEPGPLPPNSILPYRRNPDFVGREANLLALAESLFTQEEAASLPTAAVTGMGGLGKTQTAVEFCYRYGRYFPGGVFWLNFSETGNATDVVAAVGSERGLGLFRQTEQLSLADQVGRVQRAWQEPVPRLLVFDNCEEEDLLETWLPRSGGCRVLLTCRRGEWPRLLNVTCLPLDILDRSESTRLLQQLAPGLGQSDAEEVAAEVGDLPLAIHLAGGFLQRYRQFTPASYLAQLRGERLLGHPSMQGKGTGLSPTGHELNIARTYALSWEQLNPMEEVDTLARQVLVHAACLSPGEPIPAEWLKGTIYGESDNLAMTLLAEDGLSRLVTLGLLKKERETLVLHPLLASFTRETNGAGKLRTAQMMVTSMLARTLSDHHQNVGHLSTLPISAVHIRYVSEVALKQALPAGASLATLLGVHLMNVGEHLEAQRVLERACVTARETGDVQSLAHALTVLSRVEESLGQYDQSLRSTREAVSLFKEARGSDTAGLAEALWQQGRVLHRMEQAQAALHVAKEGYALSQTTHLRQSEARFLDLMGVIKLLHAGSL